MRFRPARMLPLGLCLGSTLALAQTPQARSAHPATARVTGVRYTRAVRDWHTPTEGQERPVDAAGRPMLAIASLNTGDRVELRAAGDKGGFSATDLDRAAFVLREPSTGNEHPVEPRALDIVYRIQTHFSAQEIRVISGYRTPRRRGGSNHGKGRAIDLIVPGAPDAEVAKFAREQGFVGVGVYPTSGFVHVDVRDRSYFWVDKSGPGRRNRTRGILGDLAKSADEEALARGEHPLPPLVLGLSVDAALKARAAASGSDEDDDDDDPGGS